MIARLTGILLERDFTEVVIDVNGVGYAVSIPLSTYDKLPPAGEAVTLYTHLQMREDGLQLYGFASKEERTLFQRLVAAISGVGPKVALSVLSGISIDAFVCAIEKGDVKALSKVPGIGKRTAERMILELKDKLGDLGGSAVEAAVSAGASVVPQEVSDATAALVTLGIKHDAAEKTVKKLHGENPGATTADLIRKALAALNS